MTTYPYPIIDFHVHLFPDRMFDAIWKSFVKDYGWDVMYHLYYKECIAYLKERGIEKIVYSNYAHKEGVAKHLNDWNLKVLNEQDNVYSFGAYHPDDDIAIAEDFIPHPKVLGFKLQLLVQKCYPYDTRLFPLYELVQHYKKRILMHVGTGPVGNEFVGIGGFKKLLRQYPDIPVTIAHMGAYEYDEFLELLDDYPHLMMDTAFVFLPDYEGAFHKDPEVLEKYQDRILYGSDFPNIIFPRELEIETLMKYGLSKTTLENILYNNGNRIIRQIVNADR